MRDNQYLKSKLQELWDKYFFDVPKDNHVQIFFSRKSKKRLGYIKTKPCPVHKDRFITAISVNGYFRDPMVPEFVIEATITHELCHYAHGFCSPLPQLYHDPHRGGVVDREMEKRGLGSLCEKEMAWLNQNWKEVICKGDTSCIKASWDVNLSSDPETA